MEVDSNPLNQPQIQFLLPNMSSEDWKSNPSFNPMGMQVLFTVANATLRSIFPPYSQYVSYTLDNATTMTVDDFKNTTVLWNVFLENKGPVAVVVVGLLLTAFLTLFGLGWILSKCCCGSSRPCCPPHKDSEQLIAAKMEKKRDKCKRSCCGILFATLVVLYLFGLVCCAVTTHQLKWSVEDLPDDVDNSLIDVDTYFNATKTQLNTLLVTDYDLLSTTLANILEQSGEIIKRGLSQKTGAEALNNLTDVLDTVDRVRGQVQSVERASKSLKEKADRLQHGLATSKERLLTLLEACNSPKCQDLKDRPDIRSLRVQNDFQNLPNMTDILREIGRVLTSDVRDSIAEGKKAFDELGIRIRAEVEPVVPNIKAVISKTGAELRNVAASLSGSLDSVPTGELRDEVNSAKRLIQRYSPYVYYGMLGVLGVLGFIFTILTFGTFIGFCGRQPGSEDSSECCSRATGSSFLNTAIFFMFIFGGVLMIFAVCIFLMSGLLTQVVCPAVHHMDNRTEKALRLPKISIRSQYNHQLPPYHEILRNCKQAKSGYMAFQLNNVYDLKNITTMVDRFKAKAHQLTEKVSLPNDATDNIVFLSPEAKEQLSRFSSSKITRIRFDSFADQLTESITNVDLRQIIGQLNETVMDPENDEMSNEVKTRLMNEIMFLESLQEKILAPMVSDVKRAAGDLRALSVEQKDLATRILAVAEAAEAAQVSLRNSGAGEQVKELAQEFERQFLRHVEDYADFTSSGIQHTVGSCEPLYKAWNGTEWAFCHKIGAPLSGLWFALTALLLLFWPLIFMAIVLAKLYSRFKAMAYESEAYYSAYGDGDTIPLSLSANGRRPKRGRESSHPSSARFPPRFEDTAQKAWGSQLVFNSHHTPPASGEYERPPPYYYPGPAQ